ncbi:MAG TPA: hypothetical protein VHK27_05760 [Gammaproteobacteria bacterium]|nr:hypothetical protein [Gammaproteobacteria bacterium]
MKLFNVKEIMDSLHRDISADLERTGYRVLLNIVYATPVGDPALWQSKAPAAYTPGHARFNWHCSIGAKSTGELDGFDTIGATVMLREMKFIARWAKDKKRPQLHIQNNVPYIERLNDGWSSQAPAGFVEKAALAATGPSGDGGRRQLR